MSETYEWYWPVTAQLNEEVLIQAMCRAPYGVVKAVLAALSADVAADGFEMANMPEHDRDVMADELYHTALLEQYAAVTNSLNMVCGALSGIERLNDVYSACDCGGDCRSSAGHTRGGG